MALFPDKKVESFHELIERNRGKMLGFARKQMKDASFAEDVVQEACIIAWQKIDVLLAHPNPGGWLMNTTKYCIKRHRDKVKKEREKAEIVELSAANGEPVYVHEPDEMTIDKVLSADELRIAEMRETGYGDEEIAASLGKSHGALRTQLTRMRRKVSGFLNGDV